MKHSKFRNGAETYSNRRSRLNLIMCTYGRVICRSGEAMRNEADQKQRKKSQYSNRETYQRPAAGQWIPACPSASLLAF